MICKSVKPTILFTIEHRKLIKCLNWEHVKKKGNFEIYGNKNEELIKKHLATNDINQKEILSVVSLLLIMN